MVEIQKRINRINVTFVYFFQFPFPYNYVAKLSKFEPLNYNYNQKTVLVFISKIPKQTNSNNFESSPSTTKPNKTTFILLK